MSHTSPAVFLVWTMLTGLLNVFLLFHLWSFDRFQCLKWNSGAHAGAFKRIMTYTYLVTVPMIFVFAAGNTIIKYHEGFIFHATLGIIPKPWQFWEPSAKDTIFPLTVLFSFGWSFEMITHLEELCFWLFLVNSGSGQQNWFHSYYFKTWITGSAIALIYMPVVTIVTRADPLKNEAFTFLAGSLGSLSLTVWFTPILWTFPTFLTNLRREGVDISTIVRLTKFSELNAIRVAFRFLFTVPLLILGVDGVRNHNHINESMLWTDILAILAGFGCVVSSGITLVIFFPRSIEGEIASRDVAKEKKRSRRGGTSMGDPDLQNHQQVVTLPKNDTYLLTSSPVKTNFDHHQSVDTHEMSYYANGARNPDKPTPQWHDEERDIPMDLPGTRKNKGTELTESNLSLHSLRANVNPMISNFTSPIDLAYIPAAENRRLTFHAR
ncbi:hypothetical protein CPB83DRAFT_852155 [Crepidotus variabilis]|uniref:Uncharacterized protein n=1 Tax=Crepidotus variabilis TaxID=179855 RepID=A0A9P6JRC8_9AGAR|nr:hypothetical protein CPB83DRAFT_852155 [Crepidotus variabilis]